MPALNVPPIRRSSLDNFVWLRVILYSCLEVECGLSLETASSALAPANLRSIVPDEESKKHTYGSSVSDL